MQNKFVLPLCLLCMFFLTACSTKSQFSQDQIDDHYAKLSSSWEENKAIIRAAESTNNFSLVINVAQEELTTNPTNDEARITLGRVYTKLGNPTLALETMEVVIDNTTPLAVLERARAYVALRDVEQAQNHITPLLQVQNLVIKREAQKLQAVLYDIEGKHSEAQRLYTILLAEKGELSVQYNYAKSLFSEKKYSQALTMITPLIENENVPYARMLAAACLIKLDRNREAVNLLEGFMHESEIKKIIRTY